MPSSRWLRPVVNQKEPAAQAEPTPNVSMRDVRRLAREKAARQDLEENESFSAITTVDTTVGSSPLGAVDTTVETTAPSTADTTVNELNHNQSANIPTPVATPARTTVDTPPLTTVATPVKFPPEAVVKQEEQVQQSPSANLDSPADLQSRGAQSQYLDATHTASEQRVYSVMYRETISKGLRERHYGPKELCAKTGIRSDRTVRMAVRGLVQKLSIEVVSHGAYFPQGPRYRVFEPKDVLRRRRAAGMEIDPQTKKIAGPVTTPVATPAPAPVGAGAGGGGKNYSSTPAETTGVTPVEVTGLYKEEKSIGGPESYIDRPSSNKPEAIDDEAFAEFAAAVRRTAKEITGKEPSQAEAARWGEVAEVLMTELRIAAGRTTVSSVPAFLAEHLRRRLWKKEKGQIDAEAEEQKASALGRKVDASKCPDCFGTGMWYPEGFEKGVAKCTHQKLTKPADNGG